MNRLLIASLCASTVSLSAPAADSPYRPTVGEPHVEFTLPRIDNREEVSLADFRGKKVLLTQFASW